MGGGLAVDGILLIVKGEENLSGLAEMLGTSVPREKEVPDENTNSMRRRNWTVRRWLVHFVYLQDRRQK